MNQTTRTLVASAALAALGIVILTNLSHASKLSDCYDRVIAACNKKPDHAVNACVTSGLDQCDGQFTSGGGSSQSEISKLRANALKAVKPAAQRR
jgi:hypothetical protein